MIMSACCVARLEPYGACGRSLQGGVLAAGVAARGGRFALGVRATAACAGGAAVRRGRLHRRHVAAAHPQQRRRRWAGGHLVRTFDPAEPGEAELLDAPPYI